MWIELRSTRRGPAAPGRFAPIPFQLLTSRLFQRPNADGGDEDEDGDEDEHETSTRTGPIGRCSRTMASTISITSNMLSHEKLDVYQRSIEFLAAALRIAEKLPRGHAALTDQLRRSAMSIPLNIAEGSGRGPGSADRTRFRGIARGSAMECGAILDVVRLLGSTSEREWSEAKALLIRIVEMLSKMS